MAKIIKGTFSADGSSDIVIGSKATFLVGTTAASDFGGGTVTLEAEYGDSGETTSIDSLTEEGGKTTESYVGGMRFKLTLAGATSPDIDYTLAVE